MKKELRDIISRNKEQFESKAPDHIWGELEKTIESKKNNKRPIYWFSGMAAAIALFVGFRFFFPGANAVVQNSDTNSNAIQYLNPEEDTVEDFRYGQEELVKPKERKEESVKTSNVTTDSQIIYSGELDVASANMDAAWVVTTDVDKDGVSDYFYFNNSINNGNTSYEWDFADRERTTSSYDAINENDFKSVFSNRLSTFSIDVDVASYADVRGAINRSEKPNPDAVRIEEMINYFTYDLPSPKGKVPFSVTTQVGTCPWNKKHQLLQVALKGREIEKDNLPANNLVFLLDVSGSMDAPEKLGLLKQGFKLLVNEMRAKDRISIVVYAGASGIVLPSTSGAEKEKIMQALEKLSAGGSTAGGEGIDLAYEVAEGNFIKNGNNRIILATDGDFNVGLYADEELVELIQKKRESGVYLSVLGFGHDNFQSSKMEKIADNGNGNFAFIDNILEARKVLVTEMGGTLHTIAKDVKLQLEFNPANVSKYRLIGYENRLLEDKDFSNDKVDAGELGAGHTIIALYELIPPGVEQDSTSYRYEFNNQLGDYTKFQDEIVLVKLRYKLPKESTSKLVRLPVKLAQLNEVNQDFYFAASVAQFGMLLRSSKHCTGTLKEVKTMASKGLKYDPGTYRKSFIKLVEQAELMGW